MTALVLSGGGISAVAAIGVLEALVELQIPIDVIVGNSAGGLIGALYASGAQLVELQELAKSASRRLFRVPWMRLALQSVRWFRLPLHLVDAERMWALTDPWLKDRSFESTEIPLWVTATDLVHREVVAFGPTRAPFDAVLAKSLIVAREDVPVDVGTAVRASTATPGLFVPVRLGDRILVDGGIGDDFPVDIAVMAGAKRIIGVWVDEPTPWPMAKGITAPGILYQSLAVMIRQLSQVRQAATLADVRLVTIRIPMEVGMTGFRAVPQLIDQGYTYAMSQRATLSALVA